MAPAVGQLSLDVNRVFTPAAPVSESDLFAGRHSQLRSVINAVGQPGQHAVIYGERGVGKTSLANVLAQFLAEGGRTVVAPRVNAESQDNFSLLMRKILSEITYIQHRQGIGFEAGYERSHHSLADRFPSDISPDDGRRVLSEAGTMALVVIIIDEFDQVSNSISKQFSNFIKTLSDYSVPVTAVLVGVADSVNDLVAEHESIERALVQIQMPRMSSEEIEEILTRGLAKLNLSITKDALRQIKLLAQGLPHYAHLLGLHSVRIVDEADLIEINVGVVKKAISEAVENAQQTIRSAYNHATRSPRSESLFAQVLLACALSATDELGYFTPAAVREPMSTLMGRHYDIPSFSRHLYDFTDKERGNVLERTGTQRRYRYRFKNPLMQPYVIMRGIADGLINPDTLARLSERAGWQT